MNDNLIDLLLGKPGKFFSGEEVAGTLGISRQAVWKRIAGLRLRGWKVEGVRGRGYRLISIPSHVEFENLRKTLAKRGIFEEIHILESVESTNTFLLKRREDGIRTAIAVADDQTSGRGRMGRHWFSPPGKNLSLSLLLPLNVSPAMSPAVTLVSGLSVAVAIQKRYGVPCLVKWPNDVYLGGKKLCGILTEMIAEFDSTRSVVIGIGVNVNSLIAEFPPDMRDAVISLKEYMGKDIMRSDVGASIVKTMLENLGRFQLGGLDLFVREWDCFSYLRGKTVIVSRKEGDIKGVVRGIHPRMGYLLVADERGRTHEIVSGDIQEVLQG